MAPRLSHDYLRIPFPVERSSIQGLDRDAPFTDTGAQAASSERVRPILLSEDPAREADKPFQRIREIRGIPRHAPIPPIALPV